MSEKPLFENLDEQEARHAPEELPADSPQARQVKVDEGATGGIADEDVSTDSAAVPGAAASGMAPGTVSGNVVKTGPGSLPATGPFIADEAVEENTTEEAEEDRSA